jgi:hypothetical protein
MVTQIVICAVLIVLFHMLINISVRLSKEKQGAGIKFLFITVPIVLGASAIAYVYLS